MVLPARVLRNPLFGTLRTVLECAIFMTGGTAILVILACGLQAAAEVEEVGPSNSVDGWAP